LLVYTNRTFSVFDAATRSETQRRFLPALTNLAGAAVSADRRLLAIARKDGSVNLFDTATAGQLADLSGLTGVARWLKFSPDGKTLAAPPSGGVIDASRRIVRWDTTEMRLMPELAPRSARIWCFEFTPDSRKLAVGYEDATVELWELSDGNKLTMVTGHEGLVKDVAFSNDARMLATTSFDRRGCNFGTS
jgi:WD40 repeat protein